MERPKEGTYFVDVHPKIYNFFLSALIEVSEEIGEPLHFSDLSTYAQVVCKGKFLVDELVSRRALEPSTIPDWWEERKRKFLRKFFR
ncbi:hypothetical protein [Thermovibrio sp.]